MSNLDTLRTLVGNLYEGKNPDADVWVDWGYPNHVLVVADTTGILAKKYGANAELAVAGALLHDIGDAVMSRFNPEHEQRSLQIAEELLAKAGFSPEDARTIVDEIIKPHSCKELLPTIIEGKVMATADSMAHFTTEFYLHFCWQHYGGKSLPELRAWLLKKIEKDFGRKIFFDDEREQIRPNYEALKLIFSL